MSLERVLNFKKAKYAHLLRKNSTPFQSQGVVAVCLPGCSCFKIFSAWSLGAAPESRTANEVRNKILDRADGSNCMSYRM